MKTVVLTLCATVLASASHAAGLGDQFRQVCDSPAVKSEKLVMACKAGEQPDAVKAGDRFKNVGIGAEVNTLAANLAFFSKG